MEDLIPDEACVIARTNMGYVKRMTPDNFKSQHRGGKGIKGMQTLEEDYIKDLVHDNIPSCAYILYEYRKSI